MASKKIVKRISANDRILGELSPNTKINFEVETNGGGKSGVRSLGRANNPFLGSSADSSPSSIWTDQELATFQQNNLAGERVIVHMIEGTDTGAGLALYYGISNSELLSWNNLYGTDSIHLRKRLIIVLRYCKNESIRQKAHEGAIKTVLLPQNYKGLDQSSVATPEYASSVKTTDSVLQSVERVLSNVDATALVPQESGYLTPPYNFTLSSSKPSSHRRTLGDLNMLQQEGMARQQSSQSTTCWDTMYNYISRFMEYVEQSVYQLVRSYSSSYQPASSFPASSSPEGNTTTSSSPANDHFLEISSSTFPMSKSSSLSSK